MPRKQSKLIAATKAAGQQTYNTGKPCRYGHLSPRYVSNKLCVECTRERSKTRRVDPDQSRAIRIKRLIAEARAAGATTYETGEPCALGHVAPRYTSTRSCTVCQVLHDRTAKTADREKWQAYYAERGENRVRTDQDRAARWANDKQRKKDDPAFRIIGSLRRRLWLELKVRRTTTERPGSFVKDLGCSRGALVAYIERQFVSGMSWDNWGSVWELDHKIPLYKFDLSDRDQFLKAAHYTNLQPLTVDEHRIKTKADIHG